MAKIKHIAISTQDPEATARFYIDVFGMKQIGRIDCPDVRGYFLTDGDINLAILNFKSDAVAGASGARTGAASITSASRWRASRTSPSAWPSRLGAARRHQRRARARRPAIATPMSR